jgi:DNA repair exonuclease SbcCD ATPase subunit
MRYELFHDVLAEPILDWRRDYEQRRARRRQAVIGVVLLALVAVFAGLGIWALIEQSHAQARANDLYSVNNQIRSANRHLRKKKKALESAVTSGQKQTSATLTTLEVSHTSLQHNVAGLTRTRDTLDRQILVLKRRNNGLAARIARFNAENRRLAATLNRLNRRFSLVGTRLETLQTENQALSSNASILNAQRAGLLKQLKPIDTQNRRLLVIAKELGFTPKSLRPPGQSRSSPVTQSGLTNAHHFPTPKEVNAYDALRKKVANLQARLLKLESREAQVKLLRKENKLLRKERAALRGEITELETNSAKLVAREHRLALTVVAARHAHARLDAKVLNARTQLRTETRQAVSQQKANNALQSRDNGQVVKIGSLQFDLRKARYKNAQLVTFLRKTTKQLVQAAESSAMTADLAGLLAVEAFRVTPYKPDDPAHPGPYNALWITLNRLDPAAATALIAPVPSTSGKIGTARSNLLARKLCSVLNPTTMFARSDWMKYLPAGAHYPSKLDQPCM